MQTLWYVRIVITIIYKYGNIAIIQGSKNI